MDAIPSNLTIIIGTSTTLVWGCRAPGLDRVGPMILMDSGAVVENLISYDFLHHCLLAICEVGSIPPPPSTSHHQDDYIFRIENPNLNLYLSLLLGGVRVSVYR